MPRSCSRSRRTSPSVSPLPWPSPTASCSDRNCRGRPTSRPTTWRPTPVRCASTSTGPTPAPKRTRCSANAWSARWPASRAMPRRGRCCRWQHWTRTGSLSIRDPACLARSSGRCRRHVARSTSMPTIARGLQALMMALFFHGEVEEAERVGELALAANPQDSELLERVRPARRHGRRLAAWPRAGGAGARPRPGLFRLLPCRAGAHRLHAARSAIVPRPRSARRTSPSSRSTTRSRPSSTRERGLMAEARREGAAVHGTPSGFVANVDSELCKRNLRPEDRARLIMGLVKAGVPVPAEAAAAATRLSSAS